MDHERELEDGSDKPSEYVKQLLKEKMTLDSDTHSHLLKLIDDELTRVSLAGKKKFESPYFDLFREKPILVKAKVLVPVKEHPRFNFVGKLLGPKGNSLRRLQEETMTKMSILGKGSMRDRSKEEDLRKEGAPQNAHLVEDLHVQVTALAPPAEAHARIAYALSELRKYIIPDVNDEIRQEQFREMGYVHDHRPQLRHPRPPPMGVGRPAPGLLAPPRMPHGPPGHIVRPPHPPPPSASRGKVLSILDRARAAMEKPVYEYEDPHATAAAYYDTTATYDPIYDPYASTAGDYYDTSATYYETAPPAPAPPTVSSRSASASWKSTSGGYAVSSSAEHHSSSRSKSSAAPIRSSSSGKSSSYSRSAPYSYSRS